MLGLIFLYCSEEGAMLGPLDSAIARLKAITKEPEQEPVSGIVQANPYQQAIGQIVTHGFERSPEDSATNFQSFKTDMDSLDTVMASDLPLSLVDRIDVIIKRLEKIIAILTFLTDGRTYRSVHDEMKFFPNKVSDFVCGVSDETRKKMLIDYWNGHYPDNWTSEEQKQICLWSYILRGDQQGLMIMLDQFNDSMLKAYALIIAARYGELNIVQAILAHQGDNAPSQKDVERALHDAVLNDHANVVQAILAHQGDNAPSQKDVERALHDAVLNDHANVVQAILAHQGDNAPSQEDVGWALHDAASNGHVDIVQAILAHQGDNAPSQENVGRALINAAEKGHAVVVQAILGMNPETQANAPSQQAVGWALHDAALNGHANVVHLMTTSGSEIYKQVALFIQAALQGGDVSSFLSNLQIHQETVGWALHDAAEKGHAVVVQAILGMNPETQANAPSQQAVGWALHDAALNGHANVVHLMTTSGSEIYKQVALFIQAALQGGDVSSFLSNLQIHQETVGWALDDAALNGHANVVQAILAHQGDNAPSQEDVGRALINAAEKGHAVVVQAILAHQGDNAPSQQAVGWALQFATLKGHANVVQMLSNTLEEREEEIFTDVRELFGGD